MDIHDIGKEYSDFLHDESRREGRAEKIVFPRTTEEVGAALAFAKDRDWPITLQGGRTGITAGCVPDGGLIINLSRMDLIGPISNGCMTVQPGATLGQVRAALQGSGYFFPSDLTETTATIGGMVANNASGARSYKYGSVRSWIHALEVLLADGKRIQVERGVHVAAGLDFQLGDLAGTLPDLELPDVKSAAGYFVQPNMDLVDLFIGAEGTLGVVTGITLQLLPLAPEMVGVTAFFAAESDALRFVEFLRKETAPVAIEFFDSGALDLLRTMKQCNAAFSDLPELAPQYHTALYFELEGEMPEFVVEALEDGRLDCWMSEGDREIERLKKFRHAVPEAVNLLIAERRKTLPKLTKLGTDMSVPDERLFEVMEMYHTGLAAAGLEYVIFGHIGNNHVHVNILPRSQEEYELGKALYFKWARQVVEWGGSVSAEHGIGKLKTEFLELMSGRERIAELRTLKTVFDPANRLNRGNLFCG